MTNVTDEAKREALDEVQKKISSLQQTIDSYQGLGSIVKDAIKEQLEIWHTIRAALMQPSASDLIPASEADFRDAERYRWLRDGNAYKPEEELVWGGEDLDRLCDAGISELNSIIMDLNGD